MNLKKVINLTVLMLLLIGTLSAKKEKIVYSPVTNVNFEEVWPAVYAQLKFNKMGLEEFDYGGGYLKSSYFQYYSGLLEYKGKFEFVYSDNILEVDVVDIQLKKDGRWQNASSSNLFKTEYKMNARTANGIRGILNSPEAINQSKELFYTSLEVHELFYRTATELAGKRWFEKYLQDKPVEWNLTFLNIDENKDNTDFAYKESYVYTTGSLSNTFDLAETKFVITKYCNSDENTFASKGSKKSVKGTCKSLQYTGGVFYIVMADETTSPNVKTVSIADELIKLKSLLDAGVITADEFNTQKDKLLK